MDVVADFLRSGVTKHRGAWPYKLRQDERWLARGAASAEMSLSLLIGLYMFTWVPSYGPVDLFIIRPLGLAGLVVCYLWFVARASLIVGDDGIRQAWPARFAVSWQEVAGVDVQSERRLLRRQGISPTVVLRDGGVRRIWIGSNPDGVAGSIVAAVAARSGDTAPT